MSGSDGGGEGARGSNVDNYFLRSTTYDIITSTARTLAPALFMQMADSRGGEEAERRSQRGPKGFNLSDDEPTLISLHFNERPLRGVWSPRRGPLGGERRAEPRPRWPTAGKRSFPELRVRRFQGWDFFFFLVLNEKLRLITEGPDSPQTFQYSSSVECVHI